MIRPVFADLAGFTQLTNVLGAQRSYEVVSAFFTMANSVLVQHDAYIDKYIGDAVMAFFNVPIQSQNHNHQAIKAALASKAWPAYRPPSASRCSAQVRCVYDPGGLLAH